MFGLSLESAKTIALVAVSVLLALAVASAWIMKTAMQKLAVAIILVLLAALAWSQRIALQDCADRVRESAEAGASLDTTCSFFGRDVTISAFRDG